jgi:uncharacterized membrane protein YbjE (DUF340 family)
MTRIIMGSVLAGLLLGYFVVPDSWMEWTEPVLVVVLCILLFFVGITLGMDGTVIENFKKVSWRIMIFPIASIAGTLAAAALVSFFLPITLRESMAVGAGFGWYTLAPVVLSDYSAQISAVSFVHNVLRELVGIILIPTVAARIGHIECTSLPGAGAMDVCLPIVERATSPNIAVYSFVTGVTMTIMVPVLVPLFVGL